MKFFLSKLNAQAHTDNDPSVDPKLQSKELMQHKLYDCSNTAKNETA